MKGRIMILALAVAFGLAAAYGTYQYIRHMESTYKASGDFVPVAVAKVMIPARQLITEQMVTFTQIPSNYVSPTVLGTPGEVVGKVARSDIHPGEHILKSRVASPGDAGEGLAMLVEPGRRAMTVAVNDVTGVAGLLKPGDHVDVLGTVNVGSNVFTSTLVQDIRVLAVNKSTGGQADPKQPVNGTVTLSVNPSEAQHITLAAERGSIRLVLRTPADGAKIGIPSTNMNQLAR
ncbi:MAG: Flp pilus assembly protein CpaB [Peptococcaceae bacterium]|nr:Flp pilus assembly protein CpaB [Peptococcaceae bacterium]